MRFLHYRVTRRNGRLVLDADRWHGLEHFRAIRKLVRDTIYELVSKGVHVG